MGTVPGPMTEEEYQQAWAAMEEAEARWAQVVNPPKRLPLDTIGTHGLKGTVRNEFITIAGPCGQSHTMNRDAARELVAWLQGVLAQ